MCAHCDSPLSAVHILSNCPLFQEARDIYQLHGTIREILQDNRVFANHVLTFLNYIQVYITI
jgi:predicted S18 family serine protease